MPTRPVGAVASASVRATSEMTLAAAARLRDLRPANVADRAAEGLIRTHPAARGSAKRLVWLDEFDEDIAALRCQCGCGRPVSNASRWHDQGCGRRKHPVETRTCPISQRSWAAGRPRWPPPASTPAAQAASRASAAKRGHELVGHNLIVRPDGKRTCRTCRREGQRARRAAARRGRRRARPKAA
jgi:hypothetical protein